jgi:hypothetical protein
MNGLAVPPALAYIIAHLKPAVKPTCIRPQHFAPRLTEPRGLQEELALLVEGQPKGDEDDIL